jgi:hypothetical protein
MKKVALVILALVFSVWAAEKEVNYSNDFEKEELNSLPKDFLVQDGQFTVREENGNKFLELPGAPLDSFAVFFGPNEKENIAVSAKIFGTGKGRRFPTFGVGLNGVSGYKLRVSPGKKQLELYKGDDVKATAPFEWQSGKWADLSLEVVKSGNEWKVRGKVWQEKESAAAAVSWTETEEPSRGRAMVIASPYSGTPIRFDNFVVSGVK